MTGIWDGAFEECTSLTNITIPDSVICIEGSAFFGCTGLTSITIPDSVIILCNYLFVDCNRLTEIHYNGTTEQWNEIKKSSNWDSSTGDYTIYCTDGQIKKG